MATSADADAVQAIYATYVTDSVVSFESDPPTRREMLERMLKVQSRFPFLVFEEGGEVIGYSYAYSHHERVCYRWSVDVTVYVARGHHRNGVGRQLYSLLIPLIKELGYYNAFAGVTLPNAGSVGLHEAFGFKPIAVYKNVGFKFGQWHDVGYWQLALRECVAAPEEPLRMEDLQISCVP